MGRCGDFGSPASIRSMTVAALKRRGGRGRGRKRLYVFNDFLGSFRRGIRLLRARFCCYVRLLRARFCCGGRLLGARFCWARFFLEGAEIS